MSLGRREGPGKRCANLLLEPASMDTDSIRARALVEESREAVVVLDDDERVLFASRRARQSIDGVREGDRLPPELLAGSSGVLPFVVPYEADGRRERLVYFSREGDLAAYEELRSGFTAAVSHELRTPLARLLTLLETATLPGEDVSRARRAGDPRGRADHRADRRDSLPERARIGRARRRRSGRRRFARCSRRPSTSWRNARAGRESSCDSSAIRTSSSRSGRGCSACLRATWPRTRSATQAQGRPSRSALRGEDADAIVLSGRDDGIGVEASSLPRLFERFYRADRARASRGTGLGLAIVKHIVTQAGGTVDARGGRGKGLEIRCVVRRLGL